MDVLFLVKPIIIKSLEGISGTIIEKWKVKRKFRKIKTFRREFDNTFVDTQTFQSFLNKEENGILIFNFIFGSKFVSSSRDVFVEQLSNLAIEEINKKRKSNHLETIVNHPAINDYFKELIIYLEEYRDKSFKTKEKDLIANIQNSMVENNNNLEKYIEKNLANIQQINYLKIFTDENLKKVLDRNILDLGKRYNSAANVTTDFDLIFDSVASQEYIFERLSKLASDFRVTITKLNKKIEGNKNDLELKNFSDFQDILAYLNSINFKNKDFYTENSLNYFLDKIHRFMGIVGDIRYKLYQEEKKRLREEILPLINDVYSAENEISEFRYTAQLTLLNRPYLLIYGDGGIGKSHLLADNAKRLQESGHNVFLFLGQHLNTQENPFTQIFRLLDYKGSKEGFLNEFNNRAKRSNKKTIIMIDALNEGAGKIFWKNYLLNFLNSIQEYENISVVLSIRSNFLRSVLPENIEEDFPILKVEHTGFKNLSLNALEPFFEYYKINPLVFPSLENECYNPLFLQIYCEAIYEEYKGYRGWSIVEVLEKYTSKINRRLSTDQRFSYLSSLNLVDKIMKEIAKVFVKNDRQYLELDELSKVIEVVASPYTNGYREIMLGLEEENILTINKGYRGDSIAYFTYERFADINIALVLLDKYKENNNIFEETVSVDNPFYYGTYEALSIVLPEKLGVELLDLISAPLISFKIVEPFIRGLSWRNVQNMNERTLNWVNISLNQQSLDFKSLLYERLMKHSYINESPLNAELLNRHLKALSMAERDSEWTIFINSNPEVPKQIVNMVLEENISFKHLNLGNFELVAKALTWIFSSTSLNLRDAATSALTRVYINKPSIILNNIKKFINVNDPYVLERLLASSYGAILRLDEVSDLEEIVNLVYQSIFMKNEVYPNVLIRDYARGIILFAAEKDAIDIKKYERTNPPYSSIWYEENYSLKDVDNKLVEMQQEASEKYCGFYEIIRSMTTEYGRGTGAYGDFGRYVFGSTLNDWKNQFNDQDLSNIATMRIVEYGYNEKTHGYYDKNLRGYNRHENTVERIGKKYQWISLYELLAKLTDNYPAYEEIKVYTEEYEEYLEKQYQKISFDFEKSFEQEIEYTAHSEEVDEIHLDEEEHLLEIKKDYKMASNGPLDHSLRNIDPSLLYFPKNNRNESLSENNLPSKPNKIWAQTKAEFEYLTNFIFYEYEGHKYVSLGQLLVHERSNGEKFVDKDEFVVKSKALFIKGSDKEKYINLKSKKKNNLSVEWPRYYEMFAFEYFWYPQFEESDYEEKYEDIDFKNAIWDYVWEGNINHVSWERTSYSYLIPNANLVKFFNLKQTSEGIWKDRNENSVALDVQVVGYERNLLFRADYLEIYLNEHNLCLVWDFYMAKKSGRSRKEEWFLVWEDNKETVKYNILDEYIELEMKDRF